MSRNFFSSDKLAVVCKLVALVSALCDVGRHHSPKRQRVWSGNSLNLFTPVNDYSSSNIEQISKTIRGKNSNHVAIDKRGLLLGPGPPKVLNTTY